jgi:hypothetical protein
MYEQRKAAELPTHKKKDPYIVYWDICTLNTIPSTPQYYKTLFLFPGLEAVR